MIMVQITFFAVGIAVFFIFGFVTIRLLFIVQPAISELRTTLKSVQEITDHIKPVAKDAYTIHEKSATIVTLGKMLFGKKRKGQDTESKTS